MSISIKPAELVGAKIGDRVKSLIHLRTGTIIDFSSSRVEVTWDDGGGEQVLHPSHLELAPREWRVGDVVRGNDEFTSLPVGAVVRDPEDGEVCVKRADGWQCLFDDSTVAFQRRYLDDPRTIIYLPEEA